MNNPFRSFKTQMSESGMTMYDRIPVTNAIYKAWVEPGDNPGWHAQMKNEVRSAMPLLGRALDRMVTENQFPKSKEPQYNE